MEPLFLLVAGGPIVPALAALAIWRGESVLDRADPENADQVARGSGRVAVDASVIEADASRIQRSRGPRSIGPTAAGRPPGE